MTESFVKPQWASWFENLGHFVSHLPCVEAGSTSPRLVVSVPTGQYVAWLIAAGALSFPYEHLPIDEINEENTFATWLTPKKKMGDTTFIHSGKRRFKFENFPTTSVDLDLQRVPARILPVDTPTDRGGMSPDRDIKDLVKGIPALNTTWHRWWAFNCLSPVVIIGDGRAYLQNQREEILEKAPSWFDDYARVLLSEDSQQTSNPERMYFHPFMVFSPQVGNSKSWLRAMKPRLVIVTSWSSYTRKHQSLFAGVPHIILVNRRVKSSIDAASFLSLDQSASRESDAKLPSPPNGVHIRAFNYNVGYDLGDLEEDELEEL